MATACNLTMHPAPCCYSITRSGLGSAWHDEISCDAVLSSMSMVPGGINVLLLYQSKDLVILLKTAHCYHVFTPKDSSDPTPQRRSHPSTPHTTQQNTR
jgi:hypothetical protein